MTVNCVFCGKAIDPDASTTYRKVTGWEHPRRAGGTNALAVRTPHQEWSCWEHIHSLSRGVPVEQGSLL